MKKMRRVEKPIMVDREVHALLMKYRKEYGTINSVLRSALGLPPLKFMMGGARKSKKRKPA